MLAVEQNELRPASYLLSALRRVRSDSDSAGMSRQRATVRGESDRTLFYWTPSGHFLDEVAFDRCTDQHYGIPLRLRHRHVGRGTTVTADHLERITVHVVDDAVVKCKFEYAASGVQECVNVHATRAG